MYSPFELKGHSECWSAENCRVKMFISYALVSPASGGICVCKEKTTIFQATILQHETQKLCTAPSSTQIAIKRKNATKFAKLCCV